MTNRPLTPLRGFLLSFAAGVAVLFGGHGLIEAVFTGPPLYAPARTA